MENNNRKFWLGKEKSQMVNINDFLWGFLIGVLLTAIFMGVAVSGEEVDKINEIEQLIRTVSPDVERVREKATAFYFVAEEFPVCRRTLLAIAVQETRFRHNLKGADGEVGMMQIMPDTARMFDKSADLNDIRTNVRIAAQYLSFSYDVVSYFYSDWRIIYEVGLTSYNRGHGIVRIELYDGMNPRNGYEKEVLNIRWKILRGKWGDI